MHSHPHVYDLAGQMLADTTTGTTPQQTPTTGVPATTAGGIGSIIVATVILTWVASRWKKSAKESKTWFIGGVLVACLLATVGGLLGVIRLNIQQTGNTVGNSVTQTTTGQ